MATVFRVLINNLITQVGSGGYTHGSGSMPVSTGTGTLFGSPSSSHPVRFTVVQAAGIGTTTLETGISTITLTSADVSILQCTGVSTDTLTGVSAAEGSDSINFTAGDWIFSQPTAGAFSDLATAINTIEGAYISSLTGDVTGTGPGATGTTIAASAVTTGKINAAAVTYAKIQNVAASSLVGNPTGSPAAPSEITLGANLSFSGTTLVASGGGGTPGGSVNQVQYNNTTFAGFAGLLAGVSGLDVQVIQQAIADVALTVTEFAPTSIGVTNYVISGGTLTLTLASNETVLVGQELVVTGSGNLLVDGVYTCKTTTSSSTTLTATTASGNVGSTAAAAGAAVTFGATGDLIHVNDSGANPYLTVGCNGAITVNSTPITLATLLTPTGPNPATSGTGGTLTHATAYAYYVIAVDSKNDYSPVSIALQVTTGGGADTYTVTPSWNAVPGARLYLVFGRTVGSHGYLYSIPAVPHASTYSWTDTGALSQGASAPVYTIPSLLNCGPKITFTSIGGSSPNATIVYDANNLGFNATNSSGAYVFQVNSNNIIVIDNASIRPQGGNTYSSGSSSNYWSTVFTQHIIGKGTAPTIAAGAGAGGSPTVSVTGSDAGMLISVLTGSSPTASAVIVTVTFNTTYSTAPKAIVLTPANAAANALMLTAPVWVDSAATTATTFTLNIGAVALTTLTTYLWYATVVG